MNTRSAERPMQRHLAVPLLAAALCLNACVPIPFRTSDWHGAAPQPASLEIGDDVRIKNRKTGKYHRFTVVRFTEDGFIGEHDNEKTYRVRYADISSLEVEHGEWHVILIPVPLDLNIGGPSIGSIGAPNIGSFDWRLLAVLGLAAFRRRT